MSHGFKGRPADPVMATTLRTGLTGNQSMIKHGPQPTVGVMTGITSQGGGNMGRAFAGGDHIIVAVVALIRSLAVINGL